MILLDINNLYHNYYVDNEKISIENECFFY